MPRKYSPDQKTAALIQLERNGGNIPLTAGQTGISENTLYAWQRTIRVFFQQNPLPPQNPAESIAFHDDLSALAFIRQQIMNEMVRLSSSLQYDSGFSTPYQRVLVLSQLMDKLMKLDIHLKPYTEEEVQYVLSDDVEEEPDDYDYYEEYDPS